MAIDTEAKRWSMLAWANSPPRTHVFNPATSGLVEIEKITVLQHYGGIPWGETEEVARRRGGFIPGPGFIRRRKRDLDEEQEALEQKIETIQPSLALTEEDFQAIDDAVDRELARLLQIQARAELAILEELMAELERRRLQFVRFIEDAFIMLIAGD